MFTSIILIFCALIFLLILVFISAGLIMSFRHGDCNLFLDLTKIRNCLYERKENLLRLSFDVPFYNSGKQHALIIDCDARLQPKGDIFRRNIIDCRVINIDNVRFDDYWEGLVLKPGKTAFLKICLSVSGDFNASDLENFTVDVLTRYYGRGLMKFKRTEIRLRFSDFKESDSSLSLTDLFPESEDKKSKAPAAKNDSLTIPVKTHILMPGEKLTDIAKSYIEPSENKIFTIAESALAIMQGRIYYVDDVHPGTLAVFLSHFFKMDSSLSSPYSMRKAIDEVGTFRIIAAIFAGMIGKILGRSGDFYRVAGKAASVIDDCTGTLPPFDKYIVMGPANMREELDKVKKETGMDAAVIDANDLHKVDVLAQTADLKKYLESAMEYNPAGNGNEQTPIVVVLKKDES